MNDDIFNVALTGFPFPAVPHLGNVSDYFVDAFIAAVLSFAFSAAFFNIFARKHRYEVDANQVMLSLHFYPPLLSLYFTMIMFSNNSFECYLRTINHSHLIISSHKEMLAYGVSHTISSFLWSFAGAGTPSRSFVQVFTNSKLTMTT